MGIVAFGRLPGHGRDADGAIVFDEAERRPAGRVHTEKVVEPDGGRAAFDRFREIHRPISVGSRLPRLLEAHGLALIGPVPAEMPFADAGGRIPLLPEHGRHGGAGGRDHGRSVRGKDAVLHPRPPVVAAGENAVARGRADRCRSMRIGEGHPLRRELVEVRRRDLAALRVQALHIAVAEVVGEDVDDVGFCGLRRRGCGLCGEGCEVCNGGRSGSEEKGFHRGPFVFRYQPISVDVSRRLSMDIG